MAPRRPRRAVAPVVMAVIALAGCGDDDGAADATTSTAPASTTTTSSTAPEPTTTSTEAPATTSTEVDHGDEEEGLGDLEALVPQLLVSAAELGPDVEPLGFTPPEGLDCSVDDGHPTDVLAGAGLRAAAQEIEEVIRVYPGTEAAHAAYDAWLAFPSSCTFGLGTAMGPPADANDRIGADRAAAYAAGDGAAGATLVVALVGDALITTSVSGAGDLDPLEVAAFAVGKVLAALEA